MGIGRLVRRGTDGWGWGWGRPPPTPQRQRGDGLLEHAKIDVRASARRAHFSEKAVTSWFGFCLFPRALGSDSREFGMSVGLIRVIT